jgi:uncharacterized BrkB/YihY/UPF0761 family membrane protein
VKGQDTESALRRTSRLTLPTVQYLFSLESHVYAFAIAANVLLCFFPFAVLILSLAQNLFHWQGAANVIYLALRDWLPEDPGLVDFVVRNLRSAVTSRGRAEALSALVLIFSSNGIFVPLEVALNRLWGFGKDRPYWRHQLLSLALAFACGLLTLCAAAVAALGTEWMKSVLDPYIVLPRTSALLALKLTVLPFSVAVLLLVYGILPNGYVPFRRIWPVAVLVGVSMEVAKGLWAALWPHLGFRRVYGPFFVSVALLLFGYVSALIVLAGGEIQARPARNKD